MFGPLVFENDADIDDGISIDEDATDIATGLNIEPLDVDSDDAVPIPFPVPVPVDILGCLLLQELLASLSFFSQAPCLSRILFRMDQITSESETDTRQ